MVKRTSRSSRSSPLRPPTGSVKNALLAALPADEYERLRPALETVSLPLKATLYKPGEPIRHVYFPGGGFCSVLTVLEDGRMVEVATVGREGMIGASAVLDDQPSLSMAMVQGETNTCYRMRADVFRREMNKRGPFYDVLTRFTQAQLGVIMQSTACNAVHSVEQRLARWLLMAQDRMESREFPLTQEFAAMMLGATRPTVTVVAGTLQHAGLIMYRRGRVTVVDRKRLEAAACECYRAVNAMLPAVTNGSPKA